MIIKGCRNAFTKQRLFHVGSFFVKSSETPAGIYLSCILFRGKNRRTASNALLINVASFASSPSHTWYSAWFAPAPVIRPFLSFASVSNPVSLPAHSVLIRTGRKAVPYTRYQVVTKEGLS